MNINDSKLRHDFVLLFDVKDGNPNGDPDAGNMPRVDPETMQGLVTDVCLKRKVRNWIEYVKNDMEGFKIYVEHHGILNNQHQEAYDAIGEKSTGTKQDRKTVEKARTWMCKNFYDVRMFGAVMTTGVNCGQVRGPFQLTFARSIDPIVPLDLSITRVAVTKAEDAKGTDTEGGKVTEMGRKSIVPYGLYMGYGFYTPHFGKDTGTSDKDLELFWKALTDMWNIDHSASRGMMACRGVYIFTHNNPMGNAPSHKLFERILLKKKEEVEVPRAFSDYNIIVNTEELPEGVNLTKIGV